MSYTFVFNVLDTTPDDKNRRRSVYPRRWIITQLGIRRSPLGNLIYPIKKDKVFIRVISLLQMCTYTSPEKNSQRLNKVPDVVYSRAQFVGLIVKLTARIKLMSSEEIHCSHFVQKRRDPMVIAEANITQHGITRLSFGNLIYRIKKKKEVFTELFPSPEMCTYKGLEKNSQRLHKVPDVVYSRGT
ncbi:hypothetical protein CEXT_243351 [Caerostris extrusa]|uniref:Uncharacterized protein n=2 Tax=Caerostris TaxID=172845 RepID=A0AAV4XN68_CAEEX|nr:hypothetical protein CEXT_243351 [Caerostris extrusa]